MGASAGYDRSGAPPLIMSDISQRDLYCMALAVYFEGGSTAESEDGQRHIARVVHERAKANQKQWGGSDICNVVFHRRAGVCQFSFVCLPEVRRTPRAGAAWDYSMMIARDELEGRSTLLERSIRYYMNSSLSQRAMLAGFARSSSRSWRLGVMNSSANRRLQSLPSFLRASFLNACAMRRNSRARSAPAQAKPKKATCHAHQEEEQEDEIRHR